MRSKGLRAIVLGRLVARLQPKEAQVILAAAEGQRQDQPTLPGKPTTSQPQADRIMEALGELTEDQVKALPPTLAQAILERYRPDALSGNGPSPSSLQEAHWGRQD